MKKFVMLACLVALLIVAVVPASAQSPSELTALARYYPVDAPFFVGVRTDDTFLQSLEALATRVSEIPGADMDIPETGYMGTLDLVLGEVVEGGTFDNVVRSWLGNSVAVGGLSLDALTDDDSDNDRDVTLTALEITDRAATEAFVQEVLIPGMNRGDDLTIETDEQVDYTAYTITNSEGSTQYWVIFNDVAFVSESPDALPMNGFPENTLDQSEQFQSALAELPADSYNFVAFVDMGSFARVAVERNSEEFAAPGFLTVLEAVDAMVVGGTFPDERTLALDIAQTVTDPAALGAVGISSTAFEPVDPQFARFIPAGTPLVIHSTNLRASYENLLNSLRTAAETMPEADFTAEDIEQGLQQINFVVRGLTGFTLQEGFTNWMSGDFALYLALRENFPTSMQTAFALDTLPVDFGILFEATDPSRVQEVVTNLAENLGSFAQEEGVSVTTEAIGGVNTLVITTPEDGDAPFPIEVLIAASDEVFVVGTRSAVEAALVGNTSLLDDPLYNEAAAYLLPEPRQVLYMAGENLMPLVDLARATADADSMDDAEQLEFALTLFHSSSISQTVTDRGTTLLRAVMTLP